MSSPARLATRAAYLAVWAFATWLLLTWTVTAEQVLFGAGLAVLIGVAMCPLGDVAAPWRALDPRRLAAAVGLLLASLWRILRANIVLAGRIWSPHRPLRSGMVVVPTAAATEAVVGASGLITSLIVDNQVVDVDLDTRHLQYHAVAIPRGTPAEQAEAINAPTERLLNRIDRRRSG